MSLGAQLLIMRHGPAESAASGQDATRRLTTEGRQRTRTAAGALARVIVPPERIFTSPLVRARETAEILAAATSAPPPVTTSLLSPGFDRGELRHELAHSGLTQFAIVGHEPDLSGFIGWLLGRHHAPRVKLGKGSACLLEFASAGDAELLALYPLDALVRLAAS